MKLFHKLRTFIWASGLTGFLLLFHPILTILITRRRDLSQASDLDGSSIIQIGYVVFCTFIIFRELTIFNQFLLKKIIFRSPIKFLLLFNILCFLSALWSTNTILTLYRSFECLVFLLLITLTIKKLLIKFTFDQVIEWTIWFAFWNLVVGILFRLKLVGLSGISIPFLPSRLFFPLFFFIIVLFGKKTLPKIVTIVIAIIGLSNKIFIGISMGFLSFINGSVRNKIIFVFFGISLFFIIAFFGFDEVLLNSLFYGRDSIGLEDASGRKQVWKYLINAGLEKPLIGYGFASGELSLLSVSSWKGAINSHNSFVSAFVNTGVLGLILLIIFFYKTLILILKIRNKQKRIAFLSTIIIITVVSVSAPGIGGRVYGSWIPSVFLISLMIGLIVLDSLKRNSTKIRKNN